jgi:hypothetical protein
MAKGRKIQLTDPINTIDTSSLPPLDEVHIDMLKAAHDRAGPAAVAEGMVGLSKSHPALFDWLLTKLTQL